MSVCEKHFFFANFTQEKKRMSCIFLFLFHLLMCFTVFFFIHKCHSQLYLHPSAKECSKLLKQCLHMCVCICFLRLITRGGTQQRKLILGTEYLHNEDSPTHFCSFKSICRHFSSARHFSERFKLALI